MKDNSIYQYKKDYCACDNCNGWNSCIKFLSDKVYLCPPDAAARIAKLEEALKYYANKHTYLMRRYARGIGLTEITKPIYKDLGKRARTALDNK